MDTLSNVLEVLNKFDIMGIGDEYEYIAEDILHNVKEIKDVDSLNNCLNYLFNHYFEDVYYSKSDVQKMAEELFTVIF